jgi:hypothetical protein
MKKTTKETAKKSGVVVKTAIKAGGWTPGYWWE